MFSGGDSSDGINSLNQFGAYGFVNQAAVSNAVAAGQNIDWAQLAQQWIQMRDNSELLPKIDSEQGIKKVTDLSSNNMKFEEKGEADMDMDDEEQSEDKKAQGNNDTDPMSAVNDNVNQSWYYGDTSSQLGTRSTSSNQWNPWQNQEILATPLPNQNLLSNRASNPTAHIPSLLKISVPNPNEIRVAPDVSNQPDNNYVMDAAKRKGLPAWIREGLEKMEREKQKLLEKSHQNKDINSPGEENSFNKNTVTKPKTSLHPASILDEESTDNEDATTVKGNTEKDAYLKKVNEEEDDSSIGNKTYDQKISELMIVVRHTLTELLLEVTNEEIAKVADESLKTLKFKGLAAYGDSSSDNESENEESNLSKKTSSQSESDNDSEEEIRNAIRMKRRAFIKTSEEIEERVAASAIREEEKLKYFLRKEEEEREQNRRKKERTLLQDSSSTSSRTGNNNFKGYEKDFGEITETKIHLNGKRQKERSSRRERITRFSDNKDKNVAIPNAATFLSNLNSGTNLISSHNASTVANNSQRQNVPDLNGLLPNYASTGVTSALSAADAALEKALKAKSPTNSEKQSHRYKRDRIYNQSKKRRLSESRNSRSRSESSCSSTSSSSSSTSSDSTSSSSRSSHHSKYKHRSAKRHKKAHTSDERQYEKSNRDRRDERKYSSRSYKKRDRETSSRRHHEASSDSDDDYRRRHRNDSNHSRNSSQKRSYTSSRYDRDREHSRSQSRSSYSSNNRRSRLVPKNDDVNGI